MRIAVVSICLVVISMTWPAWAVDMPQVVKDSRYVLGPFSAICAGAVSASVALDVLMKPRAERASAARNYAMLWFMLDLPGNVLLLSGYLGTMSLKQNLLIDFGPIFQSLGDIAALSVIYWYAGFHLMGQQTLPSLRELVFLSTVGVTLVGLSNFDQIRKLIRGELSLWDYAKSDLAMDAGAMLTGMAPWAQAALNFRALRTHGLMTRVEGMPVPTLFDESLKPSTADILGNTAAALTILASAKDWATKLPQLPGSVIPALAEVVNFTFILLPRLYFRCHRTPVYEMVPA